MYCAVVAFSCRFSASCWAFNAATCSYCSLSCPRIRSASVPMLPRAFRSLSTTLLTSSENPRICACPYDPAPFRDEMAVPFTDHRREGCRPEFTQGSRDKYGRWLAVVRYLAEDGTWRGMNVKSSRRGLRIQWGVVGWGGG